MLEKNLGWKAYLGCFKPYYKWIPFNTLIKGIDIVFIIERVNFYIVAKFYHFSTPQRFLKYCIKILGYFFDFKKNNKYFILYSKAKNKMLNN